MPTGEQVVEEEIFAAEMEARVCPDCGGLDGCKLDCDCSDCRANGVGASQIFPQGDA